MMICNSELIQNEEPPSKAKTYLRQSNISISIPIPILRNELIIMIIIIMEMCVGFPFQSMGVELRERWSDQASCSRDLGTRSSGSRQSGAFHLNLKVLLLIYK